MRLKWMGLGGADSLRPDFLDSFNFVGFVPGGLLKSGGGQRDL